MGAAVTDEQQVEAAAREWATVTPYVHGVGSIFNNQVAAYIAGADWQAARYAELVEAAQEADRLLAGMWSFSEEGRSGLKHRWFVQTSEALRAALVELGNAGGRVYPRVFLKGKH